MGLFNFPRMSDELREYDRQNREERRKRRWCAWHDIDYDSYVAREEYEKERQEQRRLRREEQERIEREERQELENYYRQMNRIEYLKRKYEGEY